MAKLTAREILESAITRGDPIPYSQLYEPKDKNLKLFPEYMVYKPTRPRKSPRINYTKFYKKSNYN